MSTSTSQTDPKMSDPRKINEHYLMGKTIGEGTFGQVKLGTHLLTGEKVAIKILEKDRITEQADVERVAREINILKIMRHPNIIQLYEIIETPKQLYLIMEYASGGELFQYIVSNQRVNEKESCKYIQQILSGVEYLHQLNIAHRDLKPQNLLLDQNKNIQIVDFGLSNQYKPGELLQTACGSPCYAAPEMIAGQKYVGLCVDIWSCGVIMFALICGYLPFEDQNTAKLYQQIMAGDFQMPKFISNEARDLLKSILNTEPTKRFKIEDIVRHPWYNISVPESTQKGIIVGETQIRVDDNILSQLAEYNIEINYARQCIEINQHNHVTTSYYLLGNKHVRNGGQMISSYETVVISPAAPAAPTPPPIESSKINPNPSPTTNLRLPNPANSLTNSAAPVQQPPTTLPPSVSPQPNIPTPGAMTPVHNSTNNPTNSYNNSNHSGNFNQSNSNNTYSNQGNSSHQPNNSNSVTNAEPFSNAYQSSTRPSISSYSNSNTPAYSGNPYGAGSNNNNNNTDNSPISNQFNEKVMQHRNSNNYQPDERKFSHNNTNTNNNNNITLDNSFNNSQVISLFPNGANTPLTGNYSASSNPGNQITQVPSTNSTNSHITNQSNQINDYSHNKKEYLETLPNDHDVLQASDKSVSSSAYVKTEPSKNIPTSNANTNNKNILAPRYSQEIITNSQVNNYVQNEKSQEIRDPDYYPNEGAISQTVRTENDYQIRESQIPANSNKNNNIASNQPKVTSNSINSYPSDKRDQRARQSQGYIPSIKKASINEILIPATLANSTAAGDDKFLQGNAAQDSDQIDFSPSEISSREDPKNAKQKPAQQPVLTSTYTSKQPSAKCSPSPRSKKIIGPQNPFSASYNYGSKTDSTSNPPSSAGPSLTVGMSIASSSNNQNNQNTSNQYIQSANAAPNSNTNSNTLSNNNGINSNPNNSSYSASTRLSSGNGAKNSKSNSNNNQQQPGSINNNSNTVQAGHNSNSSSISSNYGNSTLNQNNNHGYPNAAFSNQYKNILGLNSQNNNANNTTNSSSNNNNLSYNNNTISTSNSRNSSAANSNINPVQQKYSDVTHTLPSEFPSRSERNPIVYSPRVTGSANLVTQGGDPNSQYYGSISNNQNAHTNKDKPSSSSVHQQSNIPFSAHLDKTNSTNFGLQVHRGPFNLRCISGQTPKTLFSEILKAVENFKIFSQSVSKFELKCEKQQIKFDISINILQNIDKLYLIKFNQLTGDQSQYNEICSSILNYVSPDTVEAN